MKQYRINRAFDALNKLMKMEMRVQDAHKVFMLKKALEPHYGFELEREKDLVSKYGGTLLPDGRISFSDEQLAEEFRKELEELTQAELDVEIPSVAVRADSFEEQTLSPSVIEALDGFVDFE